MKIKIDSYKNIHDLTIPVANNKLILLGANGVGKSNTLEAIFKYKCTFEDAPYDYDKRFLLSLDILKSENEFYPNASLLKTLFPDTKLESLPQVLMNFLESVYEKLHRPLLKKLVKDALETLAYAIAEKRFDPSPLAIIRLVVLTKIYHDAISKNEKYIILIDTPELYCHPLLMDEIINIMLDLHQRGCLVMTTTHNRHVVSRFFTRFEDIMKVEKDENGNMITSFIDTAAVIRDIKAFYSQDEYLTHSFSRSTHYDDGLKKLLDNNLESYLITAFRDHIMDVSFSKVMILGEGASEDVLFDYIENEVHPSWISEHQVGFLNCMGKSTMPIYFIFLNALGISTMVLYDYDNNNNPVHVAYHNAFNDYHFRNKKLFASYYLRPDLEGYLNIDNGEKIESIIKPVNVFNYTFMMKDENPHLKELLDIIENNIKRMLNAK